MELSVVKNFLEECTTNTAIQVACSISYGCEYGNQHVFSLRIACRGSQVLFSLLGAVLYATFSTFCVAVWYPKKATLPATAGAQSWRTPDAVSQGAHVA